MRRLAYIAVFVVTSCAGEQATSHATLTTVCIAEERRAVASTVTREDASAWVSALRRDCDALLHDVAYDPGTCVACSCTPDGCGP